MAALSLVLTLPLIVVAQSSAPAQPAAVKKATTKIVYQKSKDVQRVHVTVPASEQGWVRTGINPEALAGRSVVIAWTANIAYEAKNETVASFKRRLSNISLRQSHDAEKKPNAEAVQIEGPVECDLFGAGAVAQLPVERPVCFAQQPGELELRFNGARAGDRGHYRVFFVSAAYSISDSIMNDGVADKVELVVAGRKLKAPPALPEPRPR